MKIKKALITCAGFGTRFLPITKTIQKEMLPILERPLIDYVVDDCVKAGIEEIIFVINSHNYQVMHYYQENERLKKYLAATNKSYLYEQFSQLYKKIKFSFVKQSESDFYGTAVPVILAKDYLKNEDAFLVLMGDDFIYNSDKSSEITKMIQLFTQSKAQALITCVIKANELLCKYGVAKTRVDDKFEFLESIVEKPEPGFAPSNLVNISKYIVGKEIWPILEKQKVDPQSGELYITDSIQELARSAKVVVHNPNGNYLDGGYPLGWLLANLTVAKDKPEIWSEIQRFVANNS